VTARPEGAALSQGSQAETAVTPAGFHRQHGMRLLLAAACAGALFAAVLALVNAAWGPLANFDHAAVVDLHTYALAHYWFVLTMKATSTAGTPIVYYPVFGILAAWLVLRRHFRAAVFVVLTVGIGLQLAAMTKILVRRPRPALSDPVSHTGGFSFPSGHAADVTVALLVLLALSYPFLKSRARTAAIGLVIVGALLMGLARVGLGVHYPTDVLAGYALGAAWVTIALLTIRPVAIGARARHH
jgi:membrane-associated phospholipid phosphatase